MSYARKDRNQKPGVMTKIKEILRRERKNKPMSFTDQYKSINTGVRMLISILFKLLYDYDSNV